MLPLTTVPGIIAIFGLGFLTDGNEEKKSRKRRENTRQQKKKKRTNQDYGGRVEKKKGEPVLNDCAERNTKKKDVLLLRRDRVTKLGAKERKKSKKDRQ